MLINAQALYCTVTQLAATIPVIWLMRTAWHSWNISNLMYTNLILIPNVLPDLHYSMVIIWKFNLQVNDAKEFVECFSYLMHQYLQALGGIVPIFNYLVSSIYLFVFDVLPFRSLTWKCHVTCPLVLSVSGCLQYEKVCRRNWQIEIILCVWIDKSGGLK